MSQISYGSLTITDTTDGIQSALIYLYKRGASVPTVPQSSITYNFTTGLSSSTVEGWYVDYNSVPSGSDPIWMITAMALAPSGTSEDIIDSSDWSIPTQSTGASGTDGKTRLTIYLYQRATSTPSKPSASTYTFSNNTYNIPTGWYESIPASNGKPCYVTSATALASASASTATLTWVTPVKLVEDGAPGTSYYTHILYAKNSSPTAQNQTSTNPSGMSYIAIITNTTQNDPAWNDSAWSGKWVKFVGADGPTGATGATGKSLSGTTIQYTTATSSATITTSNMSSYTWTSNVPNYNSSKPIYWVRVTNTFTNPSSTAYILYKDNGLSDAAYNSAEALSIAQNNEENAQGAMSIATGVRQHFFSLTSDYSVSVPAGSYITEVAEGTFKVNPSGGNLITRSDGVYLRYGANTLASLTSSALTFYDPQYHKASMTLTGSSLTFNKPNTTTAAATLTSTGLNIVDGTIKLGGAASDTSSTSNGSIVLSNANFTRSINGNTRTTLRFAIGANFGVTTEGTLYAANATVSGTIKASSGTIGGWSLSATDIVKSSTVTSGSTGTQYQLWLYAPASPVNSTYGFRSRKRTYDATGSTTTYGDWSTPFYIRYDGYIYAIGGGRIGAWTIGSGTSGALYNTKTSLTDSNDGVWIGSTGIALGANSVFKVTNAGAVTASNITATGGKIGGFAIDSTSIHTNGVAVTSNADNSIALSSTDFTRTINGTSRSGLRFAIGDKLGITGDGVLYASGVNVSGTITATALYIGSTNYINDVKTISEKATTSYVDTAKSSAISTAATDATTKANAAAKTATNYIAVSGSGIKVASSNPSSATANYVHITSDWVRIYKDSTHFASIHSSGMDVYAGSSSVPILQVGSSTVINDVVRLYQGGLHVRTYSKDGTLYYGGWQPLKANSTTQTDANFGVPSTGWGGGSELWAGGHTTQNIGRDAEFCVTHTGTVFCNDLRMRPGRLRKIHDGKIGDVAYDGDTFGLGSCIIPGVLTGSCGKLVFSIPTGMRLDPRASIKSLTFNILVRCANPNGTGIYIVEKQGVTAEPASFNLSSSFAFANADDKNKSLAANRTTAVLSGRTTIYVTLDSGTNYYFASEELKLNNQPCTVLLSSITVGLHYDPQNTDLD